MVIDLVKRLIIRFNAILCVFASLRLIFFLSFLFLLFLIPLVLLRGDPFGKDADLVYKARHVPDVSPNRALYETLIQFHQDVISPADGPRSHFLPSSSQYTLDAMKKYGFFKGFIMGCDRLQRENNEDWVYPKSVDGKGIEIKLDPVP